MVWITPTENQHWLWHCALWEKATLLAIIKRYQSGWNILNDKGSPKWKYWCLNESSAPFKQNPVGAWNFEMCLPAELYWLRRLERAMRRTLNPGFKPHQCLNIYMNKYLNWKGSDSMVAVKRSVGIIPEVNLRNPHSADSFNSTVQPSGEQSWCNIS